jgi:hypothetical protein
VDALLENVRTLRDAPWQEALALLERLRAKPPSNPSHLVLLSGTHVLDDRYRSLQKAAESNTQVCLDLLTLRDKSGDGPISCRAMEA